MVPQANASVAHKEICHAALRIFGSAIFEDIPHTSQRSYQVLVPLSVYLPAQAVDVNIDDVGLWLNVHPPNLFEDHRPGNNSARVSAQILQKHELLRRQIQQLSASRCLAPQN